MKNALLKSETGLFSNWIKPEWDEAFMGISFLIAMMSPDHNTKHGACLVNKNKQIVSLGFNGFPPDCDDDRLPQTRPEKYLFFEHAESNCINNSNGNLEGCILYVTGHPCAHCFRKLLCKRISKIVYGPIGSNCVLEEDKKAIYLMNKSPHSICGKIQMVEFHGDPFVCMDKAKQYYDIKLRQL